MKLNMEIINLEKQRKNIPKNKIENIEMIAYLRSYPIINIIFKTSSLLREK